MESLKKAHNERTSILAASYERSAAHAAFMAGQATSLKERKKWERRRDANKRKALEARKTMAA